MSTGVEVELKETLEKLDHRLRARKGELRNLGWFAAAHDVVVADIRARRAEILTTLSAELAKGGISWTLIKIEFALEMNGLVGTLLSWQERLDAEMSKSGVGDRPTKGMSPR
jgi:hypothetical protein